MRSQRVSVCVVDVERSWVLRKWQQAPIPSFFSHPTVLKSTPLVAFRRLLTSRKSLIRGLFSFGTRPLDQCYLTNDADGNENVKNTIGLIRKTTISHVHHAFLYISFPFLHDYVVEMPYFAFYGGRKQETAKFYFIFWAWIWSLEIQLQEGLPTFDKVSMVGIITIKTERTQIHFLSDVLVVVASLDLKVPKAIAT